MGINDAGQIVGTFVDGQQGHGFLDVNGTFSTIDVPGAQFTSPNDINNAGQIVGWFFDNGGPAHGFLYVGGTFSRIDVPGAFGTLPQGINNAGQIVGWFGDSKGTHGFLDVGGTFSTIDVPGETHTFAQGINDVGQIVGIGTPSVVPEPDSLVLFTVGLLGLGFAWRARRSAMVRPIPRRALG
jgi:probable HAF family extracellular repeat protein